LSANKALPVDIFQQAACAIAAANGENDNIRAFERDQGVKVMETFALLTRKALVAAGNDTTVIHLMSL
jgi:hypothetical protein